MFGVLRFNPRHLRFHHGLKCPDIFRFVAPESPVVAEASRGLNDDAFVGHLLIAFREEDGGLLFLAGPRGTRVDPVFKILDLLQGEPIIFLRRHFVIFIVPADAGQDETLLGVAGDQHVGERFSAFQELLERGGFKLTLDLVGITAVAPVAFLTQHGPDFEREEALGRGRWHGLEACREDQGQGNKDRRTGR